jgi:nicotinate-nucleotide adenylyltransferase
MTEREIRRLGVFGGTFDPLHIGHLVAASEVRHALALDQVLFVPTGMPWQKEGRAPAEDRFMMTTLAVADHPGFAVSRAELDRRGPTYTIDTMAELKAFYGGDTELFFIAGSDAVLNLGTWHRVDELGQLCRIAAVKRAGADLSGFQPTPGWPQVIEVDMPRIDVSSTAIRARVAAGRSIDFLVPAPVVRYIAARKLYRGGLDAPG